MSIRGRERVELTLGNYHRGKLKGRNPTSAQLCKHQDGRFYLHIQIKDTPPDPQNTDKVIGIDLGRRDIAVTSVGEKWDGKHIQSVRDKFSQVRASLQKSAPKGTRTTRRRCREVLRRLSGRERRYQQWLNHNISKSVVRRAVSLSASIAIEDLTGIRHRTNEQPRSKTERRRSNSWAFYQLRMFIEYKSLGAGVRVTLVPPAYTSQMCVRFVLEKLRNEGIPGSNRVTFGLSSHLKAPVRRQLNSHVGESLLKSHTADAAVKALPLG